MNNNDIIKEDSLIKGIWFEDNQYDNLSEPITFYEDHPKQTFTIPQSHLQSPRLFESLKNKYGSTMTIIGYDTVRNLTIKFDTVLATGEFVTYVKFNQTYQNFKNRELKSPYDGTFFGIGYLGVGPYSKVTHKKYYSHWSNMMTRCYNPESWKIRPKYKGCSVHPYFHNFQNFCYWCDQNYYEVGGEMMCLDKDILYYRNKVYGPTTCIFVPQTINKLFTFNQTSNNNMKLPVGVHMDTATNLYIVKCHIKKQSVRVGSYRDPMEAFMAYKEVKEKEIKRVAEEYKGRIPDLLYDRLINYEIHPQR